MPGFFVPVVIDGKKYIDGGILNNYAMNLFKDKLDETIGILVCNEYETDYKCPEQYFMAIINLFMFHYYNETCSKYMNNTIYIKQQMADLSIFNFNLDTKTKFSLYEYGIKATEEFIIRVGS